jgi:hypothetical protein
MHAPKSLTLTLSQREKELSEAVQQFGIARVRAV